MCFSNSHECGWINDLCSSWEHGCVGWKVDAAAVVMLAMATPP